MQEMGIPNKLMRLVRSTMTETKAQVRIQGQLTEESEVRQGIKQGVGLVPTRIHHKEDNGQHKFNIAV
jgi:hypothetical protein